MNAYEKAQELGLTGTDAEIVLALQATGVTANPISLAYLMEMLNLRGMLRKTDGSGGQERWVGTLQNLKAALVALEQTAAVTAYETWFSHVTNPRQVSWDTRLPEYAAGFWSMYRSFADLENMPSSADFAAIAALGGGWQFWTLTLGEYQSQKAAAQAAIAQQELESEWVELLNDGGINTALSAGDRVALKAALAAAIEVL